MSADPDVIRSCTRKKAYGSEKQARLVALRVMSKKKGLNLHAYGCPHCGQWHIGRKMTGKETAQ